MFRSRSGGRLSLILSSATLALVLTFSGPANAQSASASASPGASQYDPGSSVADGAIDIPPAISENVTGGADVVNDAIRDEAPAAEDDVPDAVEGKASETEGSASAGSAEEDLLALPETGGAPPASLCAGASSLVFALLLLRSSLRKT